MSLAAGPGGAGRIPTDLLIALLPLAVLVLALDAYCLTDLVRSKSARNAPKIVWALVILFVNAPIGPLLYLFFGRDRNGGRTDRAALDGNHRPPSWHLQPSPSGDGHGERAGSRPPPEVAEPIVTTSGLIRDYGGTGLFGVDLVVPRGSIYGLVGLNGAGKTTLLSILSRTRRPDRGTVSTRIGRDRIAVCPDVPEFDAWLTAEEVVDLAGSLVTPAADGRVVAMALATAGLTEEAGRRVGGFSRGMVQRLGLACALVGDPELLLLDEPTSALDPAGRAEMLRLIASMRGRRTVIFSSHILADVQRVADQVGILRNGQLLWQGPTRELIDTYLKPSWLVRIGGDAAPVAAAMAGQRWATNVEPVGHDTLRIDANSIEAGERGIPAVIAACNARQVSCEPAAADLESAFLALTGTRADA